MNHASRPTAVATIELAERSAHEYGPERESLGAALRERADETIALLEQLIRDEPTLALRLAAALAPFWEDLGRVDDGRRMTEAALDRAGDGDAHAGAAQLAASELAFRQGDQTEATRRAHIAIQLATNQADKRVAALGHLTLARVAYRDGVARDIDAHARQALELAADDLATRRGALHMLAWAAHTAGDHGLARARFEESLELRRSLDDRFGAAVEIANLGDLAAEDGDLTGAAVLLREALEVAAELDSQYLILNLLPSLASVAAASGDDESAARLIGAADGVGERSGLVPDPGAWQPPLDAAAGRLGKTFPILREEGAGLGLAEVLALARRVADPRSRNSR